MLFFSLAAALFAAAAAGLVLWRAARAPQPAAEAPEAAVYARQLQELDEQKAQGLLDEAGWRAARVEAGRRLLGARKPQAQAGTDTPRDRWIVVGGAVAAVVVAGGVYLSVGRPGQPDKPFAPRLAQWEKTPESLDPERLAAVLEAALQKRPNDPVLLGFLARSYAGAGRYVQAVDAFERLTRLTPGDARAWTALGEMRMAENDGRITTDAHAAFDQALKLDSHAPAALWWLGRDDVLAGRRDQGLARWRTAMSALAAGDPRRSELHAAIEAVESGRFGMAQAVAAAPPQDQATMIRGMVQRLADRLAHERGQPSDWARLVRAYTVLGDTAARDQALARARKLFAGRPQDLELIESAAKGAPPQP
jgi:cytochrome c-type biogenesis protein CcmH